MADEQDFSLHTEIGEEAKRLATHPIQEAGRLEREAAAGETDTTPLILIGGVGLFVAVLVAVVIALLFTIASLVGSLYAV
jgi:hypothetical protein